MRDGICTLQDMVLESCTTNSSKLMQRHLCKPTDKPTLIHKNKRMQQTALPVLSQWCKATYTPHKKLMPGWLADNVHKGSWCVCIVSAKPDEAHTHTHTHTLD